MTATLHPELVLRSDTDPQLGLPLASAGVQRWVWQSAFGPILIEVRDGDAFVNGGRVTPIAELRQGLELPAG
jgi:hypothetical protein